MSDITLILLGAGSATRFRNVTDKVYPKKQWLYSGDKPLWLDVATRFERLYKFKDIVIVSSPDDIGFMKNFASYTFIEGGDTRQASLQNAIEQVDSSYVLVSDIARCCMDRAMVERVIESKDQADCVVPVLSAIDTIYQDAKPIDRESIKLIQTPQLSRTKILKEALSQESEFSDDSSAIASMGGKVAFVEGSLNAYKLTRISDLKKLSCLKPPSKGNFVGFGVDIHPFENNKKMFLCGIEIDSVDYGFKAHSDGDVAIHAIIDALLGACGMGDIGELYPDTDSQYSNIDSKILLKDTVAKIRALGFDTINIDITIMAQAPRLLNYKAAMRESIAQLTGIEIRYVNIKATTAEKMGFVGRKEGVMVQAVANVKYFDWSRI
ncbi:MAG: bifunctional 2-C-methyl-D-erythritol 4-phosphate cytidylyltransferase/2-C-methyl-D-erythritol 2,4-cyclodiphosphate synthase [Campylobacterota bacterium]|nr:bifunctional 2-C-methyl-D-erythritol 4-phosphate cytidylyltransferase/2-C-methyl-D-erythritol 2,4-cyclodiphosphate synthase [Campylobacterota bacterium]